MTDKVVYGGGNPNSNRYLSTDLEQDCVANKVEAVSLHTVAKKRRCKIIFKYLNHCLDFTGYKILPKIIIKHRIEDFMK